MKPESLGFLTDNLMNLYFNEFTLNKFTNYVEERMDEIEYKDKDYQIILNEVLDSIKQKIERTLDID